MAQTLVVRRKLCFAAGSRISCCAGKIEIFDSHFSGSPFLNKSRDGGCWLSGLPGYTVGYLVEDPFDRVHV